MADTNFPKIIEKLQEIHNKYSDLRFGQVVQTALDNHKKKANINFHNYNSKVILKALENFESETKQKRKVK